MTAAANPVPGHAGLGPAVVSADPATCAFQFDPVGKAEFGTHRCGQGLSGKARRPATAPQDAAARRRDRAGRRRDARGL
ncbi:hypothetical protein ACRAWD_05705 [Caulobacter segnis]